MTDWPIDWRAVVDEAISRRKDAGLTQRSLAALAGVSAPTVNAFEQGDINLRFERIVAILDALGLFVQPGRSDSLQTFVHTARRRDMLHAAWLARRLGAGDESGIRFVARYTGLAGRELFAWAKPLQRVALDERHRAR